MILALLSLWGCGVESNDVELLGEQGRLCIDVTDGSYDFDFQYCVNTCDTLVTATCSASASGDVLLLDAYALIQLGPDECDAEACVPLVVECGLPVLNDLTQLQTGESLRPLGNPTDFVCP